MQWLSENWIWVLVGVLFFAAHLFGHGGHGGPRDGPDPSGDRQREPTRGSDPSGHRH